MLTDASPTWTGAAVALARRRNVQTYKVTFAVIFTVPLFVIILACYFLTRRWWTAASRDPAFYQRRVVPESKIPKIYDAWTKEGKTAPLARWREIQPVLVESDHLSSPDTPCKEGTDKEVMRKQRHRALHPPQPKDPMITPSSQRQSAIIGVLISMPASTSEKLSVEGTRLALGIAEVSMNKSFEPLRR